ncbi:MAG TPA: S41 family peptidase, partial [Gemmatales bacterium]|nr:S41 family peptidase [Gemmatales bacterium]
MRVLASLLVLMLLSWCSTQAYWTSSQEPLRPRESASFERNCRLFGIVVQDISQTVSEYYHFEVIPPTALAGRALLGLYRAANVEPPEGLAREPDRYLLTQPGENLADKLQLARKVLGEHALIQGERSIHQAVHALFQTLDTFSNYAEVDTQVRNMMENGCGLGLYLEDRLQGGSYFVRHVSRNSVAHKQGIRPGDELLEINHAPIPLNTSTGRVNMLMTLNSRQRAGLHLTFRSLEGLQKKLELSAQRQQLIESNEIMLFGNDFDQETSVSGYRPLQEDNWEYWVDPVHKIALLRVGAISTSVSRFIETVDLLSLNGMKSLILDLRESPIGYPEAAASLAGLFLEKNALISTTQYRKPTHEDIQLGNNRNEIRSRHEGRRYENLPLVVLTSPETSGAAEMIASALQDH